MTSPLALQHAYTVWYVGEFSSLPDHLVSDSIPQRRATLSLWTSRAVSVHVSCVTCHLYSIILKSVACLRYIHTYLHSRLIPEGIDEASQTLLRDTHVLPKSLSYEENCSRVGSKPFDRSLSFSDVNAINPLVAFYDIHGEKREVLLFYFVPDTTRGVEIPR
jgi:hypothetical protein